MKLFAQFMTKIQHPCSETPIEREGHCRDRQRPSECSGRIGERSCPVRARQSRVVARCAARGKVLGERQRVRAGACGGGGGCGRVRRC